MVGAVAPVMVWACTGVPEVEPVVATWRNPPPGSRTHGVFEGRVPCDDCERVKILTLHRDAKEDVPTTYVLGRVYVGQSDVHHGAEGDWEVTGGGLHSIRMPRFTDWVVTRPTNSGTGSPWAKTSCSCSTPTSGRDSAMRPTASRYPAHPNHSRALGALRCRASSR